MKIWGNARVLKRFEITVILTNIKKTFFIPLR